MPELRKDPIVERWVVIVPNRALRPSDFRKDETDPSPSPDSRRGMNGSPSSSCPFCPGNEDRTPPEILSVRHGPGRSDWDLRVVPNLFPALRSDGAVIGESEGPFEKLAGVGAHEVVIETRAHDASLGDLPIEPVERILRAWIARARELAGDTRLRSVQIFQNRGERAGASLRHPHSQIVALPFVPPLLRNKIEAGIDHHRNTARCLWCDVIQAESQAGERVVFSNPSCLVFEPWAARAPFETWIVPHRHSSRFEEVTEEELRDVADSLSRIVKALDLVAARPAMNLMLHTAPLREPTSMSFHWHIEIVPATARTAGLEMGAGVFINAVPPEEAAKALRTALEKVEGGDNAD